MTSSHHPESGDPSSLPSEIPVPGAVPAHTARATRIGLILFFIYLVIYIGFVAIVACDYQRLTYEPIAGVNLAIVYGVVLIVAAFALAMVYMFLLRKARSSG